MRESFRWVIVGLLVICLGGMCCATWQVRKLRGSLISLQLELTTQARLLKQTEADLAAADRARDEARAAYAQLQASLPPPTPPAAPPRPPKRRPVPVFSRESQFVARPRRRVDFVLD